jgi:excisionase family DNA binding protein
MADIATRPTISVREAAEMLGIGKSAAYAAVANGEIPAIRIGKRLVIPRYRILNMIYAPTKEQV